MTYIDYGAGLLRAAAVERVPLGEPYDLADLYRQLASERLLAGYQVNQRFYEIGSIQGLQEAERHLSAVDSRPPSAPGSVPARGRHA
jgi:NDP-sugar pyrophosphorylase family protein